MSQLILSIKYLDKTYASAVNANHYHISFTHAIGARRALALAVALGTRLAAPAHHEHVAAARRAALGRVFKNTGLMSKP